MVTKKQFKKSLNNKNKKVNSTKKNKTHYRKKTRLNKLKNVYNGGAITSDNDKLVFLRTHMKQIVKKLSTSTESFDDIIATPNIIVKNLAITNFYNKLEINKIETNILITLVKDYITFLYENKNNFDKTISQQFLDTTEWNYTTFYSILPTNNNDRNNMFHIFNYFKILMNNVPPTKSPNFFASYLMSNFINDITIQFKHNIKLIAIFTSLFDYIKQNYFYEEYKLNVLREQFTGILEKITTFKSFEEGEFRVAGEEKELEDFYINKTIPKEKSNLCTLMKHYIKYLFTINKKNFEIEPNFTQNTIKETNKKIKKYIEAFLSKLNPIDSENMISIFMYLKQVMTNEGITKMTPTNISLVITPNFFPKLQLNTTKNANQSVKINKNYIPLFDYIKTDVENDDENDNFIGPIINITQSPRLPISPRMQRV